MKKKKKNYPAGENEVNINYKDLFDRKQTFLAMSLSGGKQQGHTHQSNCIDINKRT